MEDEWLLMARQILATKAAFDGYLVSFLSTTPIRETATSLLFSVLVTGLDKSPTPMWALGRIEWLALEMMYEIKHCISQEDNTSHIWRAISDLTRCQPADMMLDIMWSPHKMRMVGDALESSKPGSNGRADFYLLALSPSHEKPTVIARVYHTTNVVRHTASDKSSQRYPESRLLLQWDVSINNDFLIHAADHLADLWEIQRGWTNVPDIHIFAPPILSNDDAVSEASTSTCEEDWPDA